MFVITADQHRSRTGPDLVPAALRALERRPAPVTVRAFERTVGDELQGVLADADQVVLALSRLHRHGHWSVGVGLGAGELAERATESRGPAFIAARTAVERARTRTVPVPFAVEALPESPASARAEALGRLVASVQRRRSAEGWEAIDLLPGRSRAQVAAELGISTAAVSQRLRRAQWAEVADVEPQLADLLAHAHREALAAEERP